MRQQVTGWTKLAALAVTLLALGACGGSKNNTGGITVPGLSTASVTGIFSEATLVAVDAANNSEVRRATASGYQQSVSLTVAIGKSYKFYLVQNEGTAGQRVYPLYQGGANRFAVSSTGALDFGLITTATGTARPARDITLIQGVTGAGEDTAFPASLATSAFGAADLAGDWQVLQLVSGSNSRWIRKAVTIAASGASPQAPFVSSLDSGTAQAATYLITPGGVVTSQAGLATQFSGLMARDKGLVIGTTSPDAGNRALVVMIKSGGVYSAADLQGSWKYSQLVAGASSSWARGAAAIAPDGSVTVSDPAGSAGAGAVAPEALTGALALSPAGILSAAGQPTFYGVMSPDKNLLFAVHTGTGAAPSLTVLTRVGPTAFTRNDLRSSWRANYLSAPGGSSGASYWGRASFNADATASYLENIVQSNGTSADATVTSALAADGTVSFAGTDFSGTIAPGSNFMSGVLTEGDGDFTLYTFIK
jgi:hypothetical protein